MESLIKEKKFDEAVAYRVRFDDDKTFLRKHRVRWQSTLMVFKGVKELGRSVADLNIDSIRRLFLKGF